MDNCIFCRIANGEIPSATLYEDEKFRVILDVAPAAKGHALILPKAHYANVFEMPAELAKDAFALAQKMGGAMKDALSLDGLNILQNNGEAAGQTVFHFHMHLIPRRNGDTVGLTWKTGTLSDTDKEQIVSAVKEKL